MCGILGYFSIDKSLPPRDSFEESLLTMRHRGPDDHGIFVEENVCLGHVRLAIMDPEHGHQPWVDPETGVTVIFNGEIYNHIEERTALEAKGYHFISRCDTEVLLKLYLEYGRKMLERLNGMFAFALYDPRDRSLFCARDHIGIKPFYFVKRNDFFAFASEIKALVSLCGPFEPEPRAILDYIYLQFVMGEKTFFRDVWRLLPGEFLSVSNEGNLSQGTWWRLEVEESYQGGFDQAAEYLHQLLEDSIRIQLRSDVPLGAHLSGGLDTGSICALATKKIAPRRLETFTAGFREGGVFDDTAAASLTAHKINSIHHEIFPTAQDFAHIYPRLVWHLDEPMAAQGVFPQYMVSKLAREQVKVVLGGQGADEILGGYTRYYILLLDQAIRNGAEHGKENLGLNWEELGLSLGQLANYGPLWTRLQAGGAFEEPEKRYWRMIDRSEHLKQCLSETFLTSVAGYSPYDTYREYMSRFPNAELLNRVLYFEASCWLPALLHVEDRMSMAVSLESRVPFLDPEIVRFAFCLPSRIKMKNGWTKAIMRQAFSRELAPEIRDRRDKLGFPVPTGRWFSNSLCGFLNDHLLSRESLERGIFKTEALRGATRPRDDQDRSIWGMLNLELWHHNLKPAAAKAQVKS